MKTKSKVETVELERVKPGNGFTISRNDYDLVVSFIRESLTSAVNHSITLNDLLEDSNKELSQYFYDNAAWYLLQVKQDLQAKGLIKISVDRKRVQRITLLNDPSSLRS